MKRGLFDTVWDGDDLPDRKSEMKVALLSNKLSGTVSPVMHHQICHTLLVHCRPVIGFVVVEVRPTCWRSQRLAGRGPVSSTIFRTSARLLTDRIAWWMHNPRKVQLKVVNPLFAKVLLCWQMIKAYDSPFEFLWGRPSSENADLRRGKSLVEETDRRGVVAGTWSERFGRGPVWIADYEPTF